MAYADSIMSRSSLPSLPLSAAALSKPDLVCAAVVKQKKKLSTPTPLPSPSSSTQQDLCWFHGRWGEEARKCNRRGCRMTWLGPGKQCMGQVVRSDQPVPSCTLPTLTDKRDPASHVFLVDTCATASIYPASFLSVTELACLSRPASLGRQMYAVNGSEVRLLSAPQRRSALPAGTTGTSS